MISANSTIAQFNRVYNNGVKNHFTLLGSKDKLLFDKCYGIGAETGKLGENEKKEAAAKNISDDEDEDEEEGKTQEVDPNMEDTHDALKIVLQR